jgi:uncharacterized membrane protein YeaQ/YmgE (transglycosylase-associated protein family)
MEIVGCIVSGSSSASPKFLMPGRDPGGFILSIVIGSIGARLGG